MDFALAPLNPEIFFNSSSEAVLTLTPTRLTALDTTKSKRSFNLAVGKSCWYCPTPIDCGSIFINSDNGSIILLAIEMAERCST